MLSRSLKHLQLSDQVGETTSEAPAVIADKTKEPPGKGSCFRSSFESTMAAVKLRSIQDTRIKASAATARRFGSWMFFTVTFTGA